MDQKFNLKLDQKMRVFKAIKISCSEGPKSELLKGLSGGLEGLKTVKSEDLRWGGAPPLALLSGNVVLEGWKGLKYGKK